MPSQPTPLDIADSLRELCDEILLQQTQRLAEIRKIADMIEALSPVQPDTEHWLLYPLDFRPVKVTGEFGIKNEFYTWTHEGIDLSVPVNYPVFPAADGVVVLAGPKSGYGNCVRLTHVHPITNERWWTWYGHLNVVSVMVGSRIKTGDQIGLSGATGNVTGPHLHLGVQRETSNYQPMTWTVSLRGSVNPRDFVKWPV